MNSYDFSEFDIVAIIAEGAAEQVVMEILYENNLLIFDEILEDEILRTRSANNFVERYLTKDFDGLNLGIIRVLDSKKENFKLPKEHSDIPVINIYTQPEIEMLMLISFGLDQKFKQKRRKQKAKEFLGKHSKGEYQNTKEFWRSKFLKDVEHLIECIDIYSQRYHNSKVGYSLKDIITT